MAWVFTAAVQSSRRSRCPPDASQARPGGPCARAGATYRACAPARAESHCRASGRSCALRARCAWAGWLAGLRRDRGGDHRRAVAVAGVVLNDEHGAHTALLAADHRTEVGIIDISASNWMHSFHLRWNICPGRYVGAQLFSPSERNLYFSRCTRAARADSWHTAAHTGWCRPCPPARPPRGHGQRSWPRRRAAPRGCP